MNKIQGWTVSKICFAVLGFSLIAAGIATRSGEHSRRYGKVYLNQSGPVEQDCSSTWRLHREHRGDWHADFRTGQRQQRSSCRPLYNRDRRRNREYQ